MSKNLVGKALSIILSIQFALLSFATLPLTPFAADAENISYKRAEQILLSNNKNLRNLEGQIYDLKKDYESALSYEIDQEVWYNSDAYRRMQLLKRKELNPQQAEHALLTAQENLQATRNNLILNLRDKYLSLLIAKQDLEIKNLRYQIANKTHEINKIKFNNDLISHLELLESEYNFLSSQTELFISKRNFDTACRNLNLFVGHSIDVTYSVVESEPLNDQSIYALSYCIENALKNRRELKSLQRELNLKKFQKELIERNNVHITYASVREEHKSLVSSINHLELQIQKATYDIEKEVRDTYYSLMEAWEAVENAKKRLEGIKAKGYLIEEKIKAGVVSESMREQVKLEILQAEYEIQNAKFRYNTALLKLYIVAAL